MKLLHASSGLLASSITSSSWRDPRLTGPHTLTAVSSHTTPRNPPIFIRAMRPPLATFLLDGRPKQSAAIDWAPGVASHCVDSYHQTVSMWPIEQPLLLRLCAVRLLCLCSSGQTLICVSLCIIMVRVSTSQEQQHASEPGLTQEPLQFLPFFPAKRKQGPEIVKLNHFWRTKFTSNLALFGKTKKAGMGEKMRKKKE